MRRRMISNNATKFKVAMKAYIAERSVTEIAEEYGVHPTQVHRWKKAPGKHDDEQQAAEAERDELYRKVGHQQVQIDFLTSHSVERFSHSMCLPIDGAIYFQRFNVVCS
jgi:transposase